MNDNNNNLRTIKNTKGSTQIEQVQYTELTIP